jgi:hypothetical protein
MPSIRTRPSTSRMKFFCTAVSLLSLLAVATAQAQSKVRRHLQSIQVTTLQLVTNSGTVIKNLAPNDVVDISLIGSGLSINAVVSGSVGSVRFAYGSQTNFSTESFAPYAMCGDRSGTFTTCAVLSAGTHTVTATPLSGAGGTGLTGTARTVTFRLVAGSAPVRAPTPAPVPAPVLVPPTAPTGCKVPKVRMRRFVPFCSLLKAVTFSSLEIGRTLHDIRFQVRCCRLSLHQSFAKCWYRDCHRLSNCPNLQSL